MIKTGIKLNTYLYLLNGLSHCDSLGYEGEEKQIVEARLRKVGFLLVTNYMEI